MHRFTPSEGATQRQANETDRSSHGYQTKFCKSEGFGFAADKRGNVAILFGLTILILFGCAGGAIDFMYAGRARTTTQNGIDAAVLAAARAKQTGATDAEALAIAESNMSSARAQSPASGNITFTVVDNGTAIEGAGTLRMPARFLSVMGYDSIPFRSTGKASFGVGTASDTSIELSVMLDITGSMRGQKLSYLKTAAADLIDIIIPDQQGQASARIALVPFSNAVKLNSSQFLAATGKSKSRRYSGCVVERTGAQAETDVAPGAGAYTVPIEDKSGSCSSDSEIVALTNSKTILRNTVNGLNDGGTTAGHLGTAWAWYTLSPNWGTALGSQPAPYSELTVMTANGYPKLKKIAVLMTDGEYNTQYSGTNSSTQARALCQAMRDTGIEVYTVGFDLGGNQTAIDTLRSCASDPTKFYETTTGEDLRQAFQAIALRISPIKLVR